jgi:hypothetical protein
LQFRQRLAKFLLSEGIPFTFAVPLLQMQPEGEVAFDIKEGRLRRASLRIEKELKGQQGEGSSYRFQSTYMEEFVESK